MMHLNFQPSHKLGASSKVIFLQLSSTLHVDYRGPTTINHQLRFRITEGPGQCCSGWWLSHPIEKYARQKGSFPQVGMNITNL